MKRKMKKKLIFLCIYDVKLVLPAFSSSPTSCRIRRVSEWLTGMGLTA